MTKAYEKKHPFISEMRKMLVEVLNEYPNMTLNGFVKYFDGLIMEDELEEIRKAELEQIRRLVEI
jgi:hypothetical protein